jgi:hypothetical protein
MDKGVRERHRFLRISSGFRRISRSSAASLRRANSLDLGIGGPRIGEVGRKKSQDRRHLRRLSHRGASPEERRGWRLSKREAGFSGRRWPVTLLSRGSAKAGTSFTGEAPGFRRFSREAPIPAVHEGQRRARKGLEKGWRRARERPGKEKRQLGDGRGSRVLGLGIPRPLNILA